MVAIANDPLYIGPSVGNIERSLEILEKVAQWLGYDSTNSYNTACVSNPDGVELRLKNVKT